MNREYLELLKEQYDEVVRVLIDYHKVKDIEPYDKVYKEALRQESVINEKSKKLKAKLLKKGELL